MKKFVLALAAVLVLGACTKKEEMAPPAETIAPAVVAPADAGAPAVGAPAAGAPAAPAAPQGH